MLKVKEYKNEMSKISKKWIEQAIDDVNNGQYDTLDEAITDNMVYYDEAEKIIKNEFCCVTQGVCDMMEELDNKGYDYYNKYNICNIVALWLCSQVILEEK